MADAPRMDHKQLRRTKKLIRKLCCNYDHGNCLALDDGEPCVCVQGISYSLLCNWFRNAVLPADHELLADVMHLRQAGLFFLQPCQVLSCLRQAGAPKAGRQTKA